MRIVAIKYKPKDVSGRCDSMGCKNPATCFWRGRKVCSNHYFDIQRMERYKRRNKKLSQVNGQEFLSSNSMRLDNTAARFLRDYK